MSELHVTSVVPRVVRGWNIVDLTIGLGLVLVVALGQATCALSRIAPAIARVEPRRIVPGRDRHLMLAGRDLTSSLEVFIGRTRSTEVTERGDGTLDVVVPELEPGTYDVVICDLDHEVGRLRDAVTVTLETMPVVVTLRSVTYPETLARLAPGEDNRSRAGAASNALALATLASYTTLEEVKGQSQLYVGSSAGDNQFVGSIPRPLVVIAARLSLTAVRRGNDWRWAGHLLKIDLPLTFEGDRYILRGIIVNMEFGGDQAGDR